MALGVLVALDALIAFSKSFESYSSLVVVICLNDKNASRDVLIIQGRLSDSTDAGRSTRFAGVTFYWALTALRGEPRHSELRGHVFERRMQDGFAVVCHPICQPPRSRRDARHVCRSRCFDQCGFLGATLPATDDDSNFCTPLSGGADPINVCRSSVCLDVPVFV